MNENSNVTNDPNVHFDPSSQKWYRWDPQTHQSSYLVPQPPPPPRSGDALVKDAQKKFNASLQNTDYSGYAGNLRGQGSTTVSSLERQVNELSIGDYTYGSSSTHETSFGEAASSSGVQAPNVTYTPADKITDRDLYKEGHKARSRLSGTNNKARLDPRYVIQSKPRRFFVPGRVFKVFWPELGGNNIDNMTIVTTTNERFKNVKIIAKIRWFVVVKEGHGHCTCLPISTYGGRGVTKSGVLKWQHGIIHTKRRVPNLLEGESPGFNEQAMRQPIRVIPNSPDDTMEDASRVHYGKMYTVEHNVQVYDFGMVLTEQIQTLIAQWQQVLSWEDGRSGGASHYESSSVPRHSSLPAIPEAPATNLPTYIDLGYATTDYQPGNTEDRQISIQSQDRLSIMEWPYPDWAKAWNQRSGEIGLVPLQYIRFYQSATAQYSYMPENTNSYVALQEGDQLKIVEHRDDDWIMVWNQRTAETGLVPRSFIFVDSGQLG